MRCNIAAALGVTDNTETQKINALLEKLDAWLSQHRPPRPPSPPPPSTQTRDDDFFDPWHIEPGQY